MGFIEDRSAGGLIHTAGFHTDHTVFHDIYNTNAVFAAQTVQLTDDVRYFHFFAVYRLWNTLLKGHGHHFALFRRFLRCGAENQKMVKVRLVGRIFQFQTFMADMPQVAIAAVAGICRKRKIDAVCLTVFDLGLTGIHSPFVAPPGSDDLQVRSQRLDTKLKTDLIVSFSCSAVADRRSALFAGDLYETFCNDRTCHRSSQKIFIFIYSMSLYTGNNILVTELVGYIFYVELGSSTEFSAFFQSVQFLFLSTIHTDTNDFIIKILLQPWNDRCGIQTAGVGKNNFFFHDKTSVK